ncbi:hypothetical protein BUE80_DR011990 [Diplocarpon rosae]|nr:hypothetical protein BUE80_DR011990 [Diplocarpon rosae]
MKLSVIAFITFQAVTVSATTANCAAPLSLPAGLNCPANTKSYCCGKTGAVPRAGCSKPTKSSGAPQDVSCNIGSVLCCE